MSKKWSKEDKVAWSGSEVMQELENRVLKNIGTVKDVADRISLSKEAESRTTSLKDEKDAVDELRGAYNTLKPAVENAVAADDGLVDDSLILDEPEQEGEASDELLDVKGSVLKELRELVKSAVDKNNLALAYRIERTIDEILGV